MDKSRKEVALIDASVQIGDAYKNIKIFGNFRRKHPQNDFNDLEGSYVLYQTPNGYVVRKLINLGACEGKLPVINGVISSDVPMNTEFNIARKGEGRLRVRDKIVFKIGPLAYMRTVYRNVDRLEFCLGENALELPYFLAVKVI